MKRLKEDPKAPAPSIHVPWTSAYDLDLDEAVEKIISVLIDKHDAKTDPGGLTPKQEKALKQEFKKSQEGLSPFSKFLEAIAKKMGAQAEIGPMKEWHRIVAKSHAAQGRKLNDLGRGRIFVDDPEQVKKFYKIMSGKDEEGYIPGTAKNAFILPDSYNDYLATPRSSGYAGGINFDLHVNAHKGNGGGTLEVQIMPRGYKETYDHSHKLFDIIRILAEIPEKLRSEQQQYILDGLVIANAALFDEYAFRTGFGALRTKPIKELDKASVAHARDVVERLYSKLKDFHGRKRPWMEETTEALSYSKTSVLNMTNWTVRPGPEHSR